MAGQHSTEGEPVSTTQERAAALKAELAEIEAAEKARAAAERETAELARRKEMAPEKRHEAEQWEERANAALDRVFPDKWEPQKNREHPQQVVGQVLRIDPAIGPSDFGTYSAAIELRTTAGDEWTVWAPHSGTMYAALLRFRVQPGEIVAIRYRGKKDSQRTPGQSYHDFRLVVLDREDESGEWVDYEQLARGAEQPQLPPPNQGGPATPDDDGIPF